MAKKGYSTRGFFGTVNHYDANGKNMTQAVSVLANSEKNHYTYGIFFRKEGLPCESRW